MTTLFKMQNNKQLLQLFSLFAIIAFFPPIFAQNVGIGSETFTPDPSAVLELKSTEQGFLPPRMTTVERDAIQNPTTGLQIFNITTNCLNYRVGNNWFELCGNCTPMPATPAAGTHIPSETQIEWNWESVAGADGYKYNTVNNYSTATDNGTNTTFTQTGLNCETEYTLYVWGYNACGNSSALVINHNTSDCPWACGNDFTDIRDNNIYQTIEIGNQCWIKENLKYLPSVVGAGTGSTTVANYYVYGYNGNDVSVAKNTSNYTTYGVLYNWTAAMTACPNDWSLASDQDWKDLEINQGMSSAHANVEGWNRGTNQGSKLAGGTWASGPLTSNAEFGVSGFRVLPTGIRNTTSTFDDIGSRGLIWTSTESAGTAWQRLIHQNRTDIYRGAAGHDKAFGFAVRCIKN